MLLVAAVLFGGFAYLRLRGRGFASAPRATGWVAAGAAGAAVVLAFVLPPLIRKDISSARPTTNARIEILSPRSGQVFTGDPARISVRVRVLGGKVVRFT